MDGNLKNSRPDAQIHNRLTCPLAYVAEIGMRVGGGLLNRICKAYSCCKLLWAKVPQSPISSQKCSLGGFCQFNLKY